MATEQSDTNQSDTNQFAAFLNQTGLESKEHQHFAVNWCVTNEKNGHLIVTPKKQRVVRGGLIADEMGLGKTIQMLGTMYCNAQSRTLIVLPLALLEQWTTVVTDLLTTSVIVFHGPKASKMSKSDLEAANAVITTYGKLGIGKHDIGNSLHEVKWDRVVFDEAHHLRNNNTRAYRGAMKVKAEIRWLMTGTPIQNKKSDFYSLCAVMGLPSDYYTCTKNLVNFAKQFILRRTKEEIGLKLPELTAQTCKIAWESEKERELAEEIHSRLTFSGVIKSKCGSAYVSNLQILPLLLKARQSCILPRLVHANARSAPQPNTNSDFMYPSVFNALGYRAALPEQPVTQSKMSAVIHHILSRKSDNRPKLVFCHYRGEIDEMVTSLSDGGMKVASFDGRTHQKDRNAMLTNAWDVLVLQIKTGCEGLNLQQYKDVYFVSPHWNPAVEDQAIARCHRMGQTEPVRIFHFIMNGFDAHASNASTCSLDSHATHLQSNKRNLMNDINKAVAESKHD